ncbi:MAG: Palmitoyl protein thioesterase [Abditibacteriota bacterium]|nr:Palmitoyl protein thioesterase [Abditibacteriota bacterium]
MSRWQSALATRPEARGYRIWRATYDTHWKSFRRSARQLMREMRVQSTLNGIDWSDTVLIGYSMGGIVARQMVAYGFGCRALFALCSPHEGALGWMALRFALAGDVGAGSLTSYNRALHLLNSHPRDCAHRDRYEYYAITYRDPRGEHAHDGVVSQDSALGEGLGPLGYRQTLVRHYAERPFPFTRPHLGGMNPDVMRPALERLAQLLMQLQSEQK